MIPVTADQVMLHIMAQHVTMMAQEQYLRNAQAPIPKAPVHLLPAQATMAADGDNWIMGEVDPTIPTMTPLYTTDTNHAETRTWIRQNYLNLLLRASPQDAVTQLLAQAQATGNEQMVQMVIEESRTFPGVEVLS